MLNASMIEPKKIFRGSGFISLLFHMVRRKGLRAVGPGSILTDHRMALRLDGIEVTLLNIKGAG